MTDVALCACQHAHVLARVHAQAAAMQQTACPAQMQLHNGRNACNHAGQTRLLDIAATGVQLAAGRQQSEQMSIAAITRMMYVRVCRISACLRADALALNAPAYAASVASHAPPVQAAYSIKTAASCAFQCCAAMACQPVSAQTGIQIRRSIPGKQMHRKTGHTCGAYSLLRPKTITQAGCAGIGPSAAAGPVVDAVATMR